jgi:glucose/arabinose dehydrogenase
MHRRDLCATFIFATLACCLTVGLFISNANANAQGPVEATELPMLALGTPLRGFTSPVGFAHAGDGSNRLFVVEQGGKIRIVKSGVLQPGSFLDISGRISTGGERGLLGLAFPPDYARRGYFYVDYTNTAGDTVISRFQRSAANADAADASSEQVIITIAQPFDNHNGGQLAFGPLDRMLYVGMGDGGSGGDPGNRAQNPSELLGKVLRLDVETGRPYTYTVSPSNPFVGRAGYRPEIWALGLRNPWRFSFDRLTSDLFIADVGQGLFEEVNFQPASSAGGQNYGWKIMEGLHCFSNAQCNQTGLTLPVVEYDHSLGCSVTGGYVYRGGAFPRMQGLYLYGDFCSGRIWGLRREGATWQNTQLIDTTIQISAFGEDESGSLYAASYATGEIYPLVDNGPGNPADSDADARDHQFRLGRFRHGRAERQRADRRHTRGRPFGRTVGGLRDIRRDGLRTLRLYGRARHAPLRSRRDTEELHRACLERRHIRGRRDGQLNSQQLGRPRLARRAREPHVNHHGRRCFDERGQSARPLRLLRAPALSRLPQPRA